MLHRCQFAFTFLAAGGMLLAGCAASPDSASRANASLKPGRAAESQDVDPKLVEAHAHYILGTMYDSDEQPELALAELALAAEADPSNEQLVLDLSRRYLKRSQAEKAAELLVKAAAVPGASGSIFAQLGFIYARLGKDQQAIDASQTAIKRAPLLLAGYRNLFVIHLQKGRAPQALAALNDALKRPDAGPDFLIDLADLYGNLERQAPSQKVAARAGATSALARATALNPANPYLRLRMAEGFYHAGDSTNAAKIYLELLDRFGDVPALRIDVRGRLADIYWRNSDTDKAREQLEAIVREDPANAQAYYFLGRLADGARKLTEAEEYFQKSLLLSDDDAEVFYDLAWVQVNLDRSAAALRTLERARGKYKETFMSEFITGLAYNRSKDYTNAMSHFTSAELLARTSEPKRLNEFFYFDFGSACERAGNYDQAEKYFEKALEYAPDFHEALNYLGYMLADRGVKLDHARDLIEKAVKLEPTNAAYLDSLGWVLYKLNQPGDALPQALKAVKLSEQPDATLFDHLGDIYAALKQPEKAREAWRRSLAVEPSEPVRRKIDGERSKAGP
jgi:tetratricopeptide (TPR) repeat protein